MLQWRWSRVLDRRQYASGASLLPLEGVFPEAGEDLEARVRDKGDLEANE